MAAQGRRAKRGGSSDLGLALELVDKKFEDMTEDEQCCYLKNERYIQRHKILLENSMAKKMKKTEFEDVQLKAWQCELVEYCKGEVVDRKIRWYVDPVCNRGEFMANYLRCVMGAVIFKNKKSSDIAYAYKDENIVVLDFSRSPKSYVDYSIPEHFKDGRLWSPKWRSCMKHFKPPHVIVFSNFEPDLSKFTKDRWDIHRFEQLEV